jgi:hypothetical protein
MLDSGRDCRYRRVAHCSIGVGLRKVAFHDMPGTLEEVPGIPLTLIHSSAWKMDSANFALTEFSEVRLPRYALPPSGTELGATNRDKVCLAPLQGG